MKTALLFLVTLGLIATASAEPDQMETRWVVILSATKSFDEARQDAVKFSKAAGIPFSMRGLVFDKKKGLCYPADVEPDHLAGAYLPRIHNLVDEDGKTLEAFISIEKSADYPGFVPGYYIVVAGVEESAAAAASAVKSFTKIAPSPYFKKTKVYMGCSS